MDSSERMQYGAYIGGTRSILGRNYEFTDTCPNCGRPAYYGKGIANTTGKKPDRSCTNNKPFKAPLMKEVLYCSKCTRRCDVCKCKNVNIKAWYNKRKEKEKRMK